MGKLLPSPLLLLQTHNRRMRELPPDCGAALAGPLWLAPEAIRPHLTCMGAPGRELYLDVYLLDFVLFPLAYVATLLSVLRHAWPQRRLLWVLPGVAALCDVLENAGVYLLVPAFPERCDSLERAVVLFSRIKWLAVMLAALFVLVGLVQFVVGCLMAFSALPQQPAKQRKRKQQ